MLEMCVCFCVCVCVCVCGTKYMGVLVHRWPVLSTGLNFQLCNVNSWKWGWLGVFRRPVTINCTKRDSTVTEAFIVFHTNHVFAFFVFFVLLTYLRG